jgi:hypothetical protein
MTVKILRIAAYAAGAVVVIAAFLYGTRSNPIGPISGRALSGELVTTPVDDWSFTDEHSLIAVETRPSAPHSVTTVCFTVDGDLYVPAQEASTKSWTHYAVSNPAVRILVDGRIYPVRATRVSDPSLIQRLRDAIAAKYDFVDPNAEVPEDLWVFRMESARDVAAR